MLKIMIGVTVTPSPFFPDIMGLMLWQVYPPLASASGEENARRSHLSGVLCYLGGLAVRVLLDLSKYHIGERLVASSRSSCARILGTWLYITIFALAGLSFWRGTWYLMEISVGDNVSFRRRLLLEVGRGAKMAWQKKRERIGKVSSEMSGNAFKFGGWGGGGGW
jgi:hypothetical protein